MPDSLYIYGEVLQDKNVKETEYDDYMDLTASNYGHALRHVLATGDTRVEDLANWQHPSNPGMLVTWVESHDTYCNDNESAGLTDDQIRTRLGVPHFPRHGQTALFQPSGRQHPRELLGHQPHRRARQR